MLNRFKALSLAAFILLSVVGCTNTNVRTDVGETVENKYGDYPIQSDVKLSYWVTFSGQSQSGVTNFAQLEFYKALKEKTGIDIEFQHPINHEQFNLMLASGEYPDIIESNFYTFPGGPEKAINDGYIIELNDVIEKYAPNLLKYYKERPEVDKMAKTDGGSYYSFPFIRDDRTLMVYQGPIVRKDWLDELNLSVPETIDEWYTVLKAFKEKENVEAPLSFSFGSGILKNSGAFMGAFGVKQGLYVTDGEIKLGELEPGYKEFVETFRKWYAEGLIDKNIATIDSKILDTNMLNDKSGASLGNTGGGIGKWMKAMEVTNPDYKLVAAPYPTLRKGDIQKFGQWDLPFQASGAASISTQCKDVELAARLLDYGYSDEGRLLCNFGISGVSYNMKDGYPQYTDLILNNKDGKSMSEMVGIYCRPNGNGPYIQDPRFMEQFAALPEQKESLIIWSNTDALSTNLPMITLTLEESNEGGKIKNDLETYSNEMLLKFIMGVEPLEKFDDFVAQLKKIGAERYIELNQNALDRYNNR